MEVTITHNVKEEIKTDKVSGVKKIERKDNNIHINWIHGYPSKFIDATIERVEK